MEIQENQNWPVRIQRLLDALCWNQSRLAHKLFCREQTVNRWVNGKSRPKAYRKAIEELERREGLLQDNAE